MTPTHLDDSKVAYSISNVAEKLGVSERHVHRLVRRGELASFKLGQRRLISREALANLMTGTR